LSFLIHFSLTDPSEITYSLLVTCDNQPSTPLTKHRLRSFRRHLHHLPVAVALICSSAATHAAPDTSSADPVMRLLEQRGLVPLTGSSGNSSAASQASLDDHSLLGQVRDKASDLVVTAMNFIGVRYKMGGNNASDGFDCSGFTRYIFENSIGLVLPRRAEEQARDPSLLKINMADLRPGDLVFFNTLRQTFSHVGIYVGDGKFIHAPRTGSEVRIEDMHQSYWMKRFTGARRVPQINSELNNNQPE
jgi:cell wall-associated NlpC family hydrolase